MSAQIAARPTVYKGINMRSRLEAGFAAWLDGHDFDWSYEPYCVAGDAGQYLPDFLVRACLRLTDPLVQTYVARSVGVHDRFDPVDRVAGHLWDADVDVHIEIKPVGRDVSWPTISRAARCLRDSLSSPAAGLLVVVTPDSVPLLHIPDSPRAIPLTWIWGTTTPVLAVALQGTPLKGEWWK